jgi:adenine phosphoribosyltransferase
METYLKSKIRNIANFPKKGIVFRDITTLMNDREALQKVAETLAYMSKDLKIDKVAGIESRGFILAGVLAEKLHAGLVLIRKPGKLPAETLSQNYELEYGTDTLEMHKDAIRPGERVLIHDDLLATGGTARAACDLIEKAGGIVVKLSFIVELSFLKGRDKISNYPVDSLVTYDRE